MIVGSMTFAQQMMETKRRLEQHGHFVSIPCDTEIHVEDSQLIDNLDADLKHVQENNIMRQCFQLVADSDAILVLNHPKNDIDGYMGTSTLMECGLAYHLGKKIFVLNNIPHYNDHRWAHEIHAMDPTFINGDVGRIN